VSAETKLELLGLIDGAVADGWAHTRACRVLDLADVRAHRWRQRLRETGTLDDRDPGGGAVHGILPAEEQAILDLIEQWGWVDRSHRKLAHRGSYTGTVFVSPSTVLRVALKNQVTLPGEPVRPRPQMPVFPEVPWERNRIWIWDCSHFTRCKRVAYAIVDVVTRYWIGYLSPPSRPRPRRSCCSLARWRTRGCSSPMGCRAATALRTLRSSSLGLTTGRR
jgi:hypothetical protein